MRTRASKAREALEGGLLNYTWCLLCTGKKKTGFYTSGTLRRHYALKHLLDLAASEPVPRSLYELRRRKRDLATIHPPDENEQQPQRPQLISHDHGKRKIEETNDQVDSDDVGGKQIPDEPQSSLPFTYTEPDEAESFILPEPEPQDMPLPEADSCYEDYEKISENDFMLKKTAHIVGLEDVGGKDVQDEPRSSLQAFNSGPGPVPELPPVDILPESPNQTSLETFGLKRTVILDEDNEKLTGNIEEQEEEEEIYQGVPENQHNAWRGRCGRLKYLCYGCFVWFNDKYSIDRHFYLRHLCDVQKWPEDFPPLGR